MFGFFTPDEVKAFAEARRKAHAKLACGPNEHLTLNDLRGLKIQPSESVDMFREMLAAPDYRSRRLAFVVAPTLAFLSGVPLPRAEGRVLREALGER